MSHNSTESHPPGTGERRPRPGGFRSRLYRRLHANPALSLTTKLIITTVGTLVIVGGVIMMVTPGPGIVAIVLGLAILSTEYEWADRWLAKARDKAHQARLRAEAMDPRVRRRRILLTGLVMLVVVGTTAAYVTAYDWPGFAVDGWDWLQSLAGWIPELPGM